MVETGPQQLRLCICHDHLMCHMGLLHGNQFYRVFLLDNLLRCGSNLWCRSRGSRYSNRGCGGISSIVAILILIFILSTFSHAAKSNLLAISVMSSSRD
jgi:hypothetical protein